MTICNCVNNINNGYTFLSEGTVRTASVATSEQLLQMATGGALKDLNLDSDALERLRNSDEAQVIVAKDPEVKKIQKDITLLKSIDKQLDELDQLSRLPAGRRPDFYRHNRLFRQCSDRIRNGRKLDLRLMQAGTFSSFAATSAFFFSRLGPLSGAFLNTLLAGGVFTLLVVPWLYNDKIVPGKAEKIMPEEIAREKAKLGDALNTAEKYLEKKKTEVLEKYVKDTENMIPGLDEKESLPEITDTGDYVEIDGIKIDKRLEEICSRWTVFAHRRQI